MSNDLQAIITQALNIVKKDNGKINLAELQRITGLSRQRLRTLKKNNFIIEESKKKGDCKMQSKVIPFSDKVDDLLRSGITNSVVIKNRISEEGFKGSLSSVKRYITKHKDLVPAKRVLAVKTPNRVRRYTTGPGEMFQMDWGFVSVNDGYDHVWNAACFAMVCHHCGYRYIEFFTSARQENLFIGMLHAFEHMGIPQTVLTDNMKSVVTKRNYDGSILWNSEYDRFQQIVGFETKLCKVAHPFTKGAVERLVRYVKENFLPGRTFLNLTDLNTQVAKWCLDCNSRPSSCRECIPNDTHLQEDALTMFQYTNDMIDFYAPERTISYDGCVSYEGREYGVPLSFPGKKARVIRTGEILEILDPISFEVLIEHPVDWSKEVKTCEGQWAEPEEKPTQAVTTAIEFAPISVDRMYRFERFALPQEETTNDC